MACDGELIADRNEEKMSQHNDVPLLHATTAWCAAAVGGAEAATAVTASWVLLLLVVVAVCLMLLWLPLHCSPDGPVHVKQMLFVKSICQ